MNTPLDLEWARRCATDFADKPTDARARNAAQCLAGLLDLIDALMKPGPTDPAALRAIGLARIAEALDIPDEIKANPEAYTLGVPAPALCPGFPQARPEDARLACFKPAGHVGEHSNTPPWLKAGIDPCPARSHQNETCLKGYLHTGGHEWGGTKTIEAGPELPVNDCTPCSATREDSYDRKTLTCIRRANHDGRHKMRTGVESYLEWSDLALLGEPNDPDQTPKNCRCTVGPEPAAAPDEQEHRCPRCGSTSWVSVSLNQGWTRRAQCVPCGHVHAELGAGWRKEAATRPAGDAIEPRTGVGG